MQLITLILCALATAAPIPLNRYVKGAFIGGTAAVGLTVAIMGLASSPAFQRAALNAANDAQLYKGLINAGTSISHTPVPSVAEAALGGTVIE
jgi:hypothetical protein